MQGGHAAASGAFSESAMPRQVPATPGPRFRAQARGGSPLLAFLTGRRSSRPRRPLPDGPPTIQASPSVHGRAPSVSTQRLAYGSLSYLRCRGVQSRRAVILSHIRRKTARGKCAFAGTDPANRRKTAVSKGLSPRFPRNFFFASPVHSAARASTKRATLISSAESSSSWSVPEISACRKCLQVAKIAVKTCCGN